MPRKPKPEQPDPWAEVLADPEKHRSLAEEFHEQHERARQAPREDWGDVGSRWD